MKSFRSVRIGILVGLIGSLVAACNNSSDIENPNDQLNREITAIDQYLDQQGITAFKHFSSGIRIQIVKMGTDFPAGIDSSIDVDYTGKLFDTGATFDAGNATGALSTYIHGWRYSLTSLPAGTQAVLYIPSLYGYGTAGKGSIPGNATLIFHVKFNRVVKSSAELQRLGSDTLAVDNYLSSKGIDAIKDTTGVRYVISEPGIGAPPTWFNKVKFKTKYRLLTSDANVVAEFEQEPDETTNNLVIDQIADGLKFGLQKIGIGGKITLYIPSGLGFGTRGASQGSEVIIPANSNIIIDLELISIVP
jgi:FKBP-type peptidyl-prolyl cis-trans isomerase